MVSSRSTPRARSELSRRALTLGLVFANAWFEEVTSRAVPLRLWEERSVRWRRCVCALAFALQHLSGEAPSLPRLAHLLALGVLLGALDLVRGHVGLATGVHAGWFYATLLLAGRFEAGSWIAIDELEPGAMGRALELADATLVAVALGLVAWPCWRRVTPR